MDEPWATPADCSPVRLRRATDAAAPRLATSVAVWYDDDYLTVLFSATDDHIRATYHHDDDPLYEQDVVEVFLAPDGLQRYFEIEVNPHGAVFDARDRVARRGRGRTCRPTADGRARAASSRCARSPSRAARCRSTPSLRIPFAALDRATPGGGETWRGNFFRIDRHPEHGDEFSAWQPTMKDPADFHVDRGVWRCVRDSTEF